MAQDNQLLFDFAEPDRECLLCDGQSEPAVAHEIDGLEKRLQSEPIPFPTNPFFDVFKRFGRDELYAGLGNVASTAGFEFLFRNVLSKGVLDASLAGVGPVAEKIWLLADYWKESYNVWKTTPKDKRKKVHEYVWDAVRAGKTTLIEDIIVHDPIYAGMVYAGLKAYPDTPAWMISTVAFMLSVTLVSGLEIGVTELRYKNLQGKLKNAGLRKESYFESRFFISKDKHPEGVMDTLSREFGLHESASWDYHDIYIPNNLPHFSGRRPHIRLRDRENSSGEHVRTAQVIYRKEVDAGRREEWHTYLPTRKDKYFFMIEQDKMPSEICGIEDDSVRRCLSRLVLPGAEPRDIRFTREYARNPRLLVSTDHVHLKRPFYVVEMKVYDEIELMKEAMRYAMFEFPVIPTVHGKERLLSLQD